MIKKLKAFLKFGIKNIQDLIINIKIKFFILWKIL